MILFFAPSLVDSSAAVGGEQASAIAKPHGTAFALSARSESGGVISRHFCLEKRLYHESQSPVVITR